jgi:hypothetical protein
VYSVMFCRPTSGCMNGASRNHCAVRSPLWNHGIHGNRGGWASRSANDGKGRSGRAALVACFYPAIAPPRSGPAASDSEAGGRGSTRRRWVRRRVRSPRTRLRDPTARRARSLAPRRLEAGKRYRTCVVPVLAAGVATIFGDGAPSSHGGAVRRA